MSENEIKPVAWCAVDDMRNEWAFAWGGTGRRPWHDSPLYDQSAIDRLTADLDDLHSVLAALQDRHREVMAERDAAVADAARWQELCRQLDAGTFPSIVIDDAMAMGAGALELQVDAARAQERKE